MAWGRCKLIEWEESMKIESRYKDRKIENV